MFEFTKKDKYSYLNGQFLYASAVRGVLQSTRFLSDDLMSTNIYISHFFGYANCFCPTCKDYDKKKAELFATALMLSYIPYGKAGYEYVSRKLNGKPVWEYQYENALNTFALDNGFFDEEEREELREMFRQYGSDVVKADFCGFVIIAHKAGIASRIKGERSFSDCVVGIYNDVKEKGLTEIDLSLYLPSTEVDLLDDEKIAYLDRVLEIQRRTATHYFPLPLEDYTAIVRGNASSMIAYSKEPIKVGDVLKFCWDCLVMTATVTQASEMANMQPDESSIAVCSGYACEVDDDEDHATLVCFECEERAQSNYGYYHVDYRGSVLGKVEKAKYEKDSFGGFAVVNCFMLLLKDAVVYQPIYMYESFIMRDIESGKTMLAKAERGAIAVHSKEELLASIGDRQATMSRSEIENGALTDEDYKNGIVVCKVYCKEKED